MKKIIAICIFIVSCKGQESFVESYKRSQTFSFTEQQELMPNSLFEAVVNQEPQEFLEFIINENGQYLVDTNAHGDTVLAVAIDFNNYEAALFIAQQISPKHYLHTNSKGEGYIYLASKKGYVNLIQILADRFYKSRQEALVDYEFSDLDQPTLSGEKALHVAKSYSTAEALEYEYWRGSFEMPLRKFQFFENHKDQSFLHTAVRDRNSDLLYWGLNHNCETDKVWESEPYYYRFPKTVWRAIQTYGKSFWLDWDDLVNGQDDQGRTAINFSAETLFLEGIKIISNCRWVDYLLQDDKGNTALQKFLMALDPLQTDHEENIYEVFTLLMESRTKLTWLGVSDHINSVNHKGESSLHIAARLKDSFFYNQLKKYGNIDKQNKEGHTPREIFNSRQTHF